MTETDNFDNRIESTARLLENAAVELQLAVAESGERPEAERLLRMVEH